MRISLLVHMYHIHWNRNTGCLMPISLQNRYECVLLIGLAFLKSIWFNILVNNQNICTYGTLKRGWWFTINYTRSVKNHNTGLDTSKDYQSLFLCPFKGLGALCWECIVICTENYSTLFKRFGFSWKQVLISLGKCICSIRERAKP